MLKILGRVIVHSLLHEGTGFPFLTLCLWYLVSGSADVAVNYVLVSDLHRPVAKMIRYEDIIVCWLYPKLPSRTAALLAHKYFISRVCYPL